MESALAELLKTALAEIPTAADEAALEELRLKYLGKKGSLTAVSAGMRDVPPDRKAAVGAALNETRIGITAALETRKAEQIAAKDAKDAEGIDLTLPGRPVSPGALHPLTQVLDRAVGILRRMGFALATGPEVETEWHCFDALNTPGDHPARHESDTF